MGFSFHHGSRGELALGVLVARLDLDQHAHHQCANLGHCRRRYPSQREAGGVLASRMGGASEHLVELVGRALAPIEAVRVAYVFGSRARGEGRADSDLDGALVYERTLDWMGRERARRDVLDALSKELGTLGERADLVDLARRTVLSRSVQCATGFGCSRGPRRNALPPRCGKGADTATMAPSGGSSSAPRLREGRHTGQVARCASGAAPTPRSLPRTGRAAEAA